MNDEKSGWMTNGEIAAAIRRPLTRSERLANAALSLADREKGAAFQDMLAKHAQRDGDEKGVLIFAGRAALFRGESIRSVRRRGLRP